MTDVQWQVSGPSALVWVDWGEEVAVYHTGNGDTHLLSPLAANILGQLESGPLRVDDIVVSLPPVSFETDDSQDKLVRQVLAELYRLNIIEQAEN